MSVTRTPSRSGNVVTCFCTNSPSGRAASKPATEDAAANGATISITVLDRGNNQMLSNGNDQLIAIASVAKPMPTIGTDSAT